MKATAAPTTSPAPTAALRLALLTDRERALTQLYRRAFPVARRYVQGRGGSAQDAQDVFQDALVIFYEKAMADTLALTAAPSTYLVSICQNLWRHEMQRRQRHPHAALTDEQTQLADEAAEASGPAPLSVLDYVEQLGEKCKHLLLDFYYFQQPLGQIAARHQYGSVRSATVQKFKCLERLRHRVRAVWQSTLVEN